MEQMLLTVFLRCRTIPKCFSGLGYGRACAKDRFRLVCEAKISRLLQWDVYVLKSVLKGRSNND